MHTDHRGADGVSTGEGVSAAAMTTGPAPAGDEPTTWTIERQYLAPVFQHIRVEAASLEEACRKALEDEDWTGQRVDYECARATEVTLVTLGSFEDPYDGEPIELPARVVGE